MPPRILMCVSIDCECDKGPGWRTRRPLSFDGVREGIARRLQPLFRSFRAKPTYLLSPETLRDARAVEEIAGLRDCELGTHLHGEFAEPGAFEPDVTSAVQREYPAAIERAKLAWLRDAFHSAFGRAPRSFRAGRFGVGPNTLGALEALGYAVDSSVTPHVDWSSVARGLSFVGAPTQPYRPHPLDPARAGDSAVLEVPVTVRPRRMARVPLLGRRLEARWLRPTRHRASQLVAIAREEIEQAQAARPGAVVVLNAMLHNVEVVAGASPYASSEAQAARILRRLAALLAFAARHEIACVGLTDVAEVWPA